MRRWSIGGRIMRSFALTAAFLAIVSSLTTSWLLGRSVERELDALAHEELDEMRAFLEASPGDRESFRTIGEQLGREHANRLAWRIWEGPRLWAVAGAAGLLEQLPERPLRPDDHVAGRIVFARRDLGDGRTLTSIVDGTPQQRLLARYRLMVFALGLGTTLLAVSIGAWLGRSISRTLARVADEVRAIDHLGAGSPTADARAPREIQVVAEALSGLLVKLRREQERAWLMAAGLAHELRSPVQTLLNECEVALLNEREPAQYRAVLESQVEELEDLARVVDNLVTLVRPDQAPERALESFDLGREAELRLARDRQRAGERGVELEVSEEGDLALRGDREALLLALKNLVGNALEWAPPRSTVRVRLHGEPERVTLTVEDAGPGVPEEERERIFEPFYRGPRSGNPGAAGRVGYGLGLALTRAAVRAHGGTLEVDRSPLGGARFRIALARM